MLVIIVVEVIVVIVVVVIVVLAVVGVVEKNNSSSSRTSTSNLQQSWRKCQKGLTIGSCFLQFCCFDVSSFFEHFSSLRQLFYF